MGKDVTCVTTLSVSGLSITVSCTVPVL
jgi:hypothetical protein